MADVAFLYISLTDRYIEAVFHLAVIFFSLNRSKIVDIEDSMIENYMK